MDAEAHNHDHGHGEKDAVPKLGNFPGVSKCRNHNDLNVGKVIRFFPLQFEGPDCGG